VLKTAKRIILNAWKRTGLIERVRDSRWRRNRLVILCYHGISQEDEHEWNPQLYMSAALLRSRLEILRQGHYHVVGLPDAVRLLQAGDLPDRAVALTFDDGFRDFFSEASPALAEFNYAATVYLTTYYCAYQKPVFDTMSSYVLWKGRDQTLDSSGILEHGGRHRLQSSAERGRVCDLIRRRAAEIGLSASQKDDLARALAGRLGVDYEGLTRRRVLHIMNPSEVAQLPADRIDVELHTHRHRTPEDRELFLREIVDNRTAIASMTGKTPSHFCYPSGIYKPAFVPWLREAGVMSATTCIPGLASHASDPMAVPRFVDTSTVSSEAFEAWIAGVATMFPAMRRLLAPWSASRAS
jgi:peptidoglycan/xylan/chitin deacetylase (PgdA/CDA1 family)